MCSEDEIDLACLADCSTPFVLYDLGGLATHAKAVAAATNRSGCTLLYALKACSDRAVVETLAPHVMGFACSSLFETQLASEMEPNGEIHLTSPGIRTADIPELLDLATCIHANSLSQWARLHEAGGAPLSLRVNPGLSTIDDERYDPCRQHSKLGVPLEAVREAFETNGVFRAGLGGVAFHTHCESPDFAGCTQTVERLEDVLGPVLESVSRINLGGGYLFAGDGPWSDFVEIAQRLRSRYGLEVFVEPGSGLVARSAVLVASVVDLLERDGVMVAVLDTTVNHLPEVLEFDYSPDVCGEADDGEYEYLLAGASCLAGDLFGVHAFAEPLEVGQRIVFPNVGAYSGVKAHMFNGINLPDVYVRRPGGEVERSKRFTFDDFSRRL